MANVIINSSKLDSLAEHIADKAEASLPLTIAGMEAAVDGLELENDFIVTINYTTDPEWTQNGVLFIPDCTYTELESAYSSGKNIIFCMGEKTGPYTKSTAYVKGIIDDKSYDNIMIVYFVGGQSNNPESYDNRFSNFSIEYDRMEYHWGYSEDQGEGILYSGIASSIIPYGTLNITSNEVGSSGTIIAPSYHQIQLPILTLPTTVSSSQGTSNTQIAAITPSTSNQYINISTGFNRTKSSYRINSIPSQYIIPTGTKSITANGTGIDVAQYASVDVAVPEGAFVVTLSYNNQTEMWEPDCTINELQAAYSGGKSIALECSDGNAVSWYYDDDYVFVYAVYSWDWNNLKESEYIFTVDGVEHNGDTEMIVPAFDSPSRTYTPTTQQQTETITYDSSQGYNGIQQVNVTVNAMPTGTAGTPTATKGTVSNHAVSVTPSVTNTTGYITGGTKTGTAVSVSASELVSGTLSITSSGTHDVTNYASASVASGGATASVTKGTVSNHSVTVTPSVTRTAGYVTAGTANGTAVTVSASELVSGTYTVDSSGTKDVTNYASASVPSGSATASATKGSVSNHSVSVTPSVTRTAGWVSAGTASGTAVTVSASELVSGSETKTENGTYDVTNLASLIVNVDGGSSSYTRTVVVPEQTVVAGYGSDDQAILTSVAGLEENEVYVITYDGTEYVSSCTLMWSQDYTIGELVHFFQGPTENNFPFGVIWEQGVMYFATNEKISHTIKVEHLEFIDGPLNLITKSITANGTYNASSDNADGYSSVTVNVPSGGGTYQAKTNISPTTSSQTITPDSGYDALSSVQINAMPSGTAGTPTATKGSVSNHSITVTPSVTNTTGYITGSTKTGTAVTVSASELVSGSETKTANGTYNVTNLASLVVSIPIVTYHTSSSAPTSSQGSNGDLWLVTA